MTLSAGAKSGADTADKPANSNKVTSTLSCFFEHWIVRIALFFLFINAALDVEYCSVVRTVALCGVLGLVVTAPAEDWFEVTFPEPLPGEFNIYTDDTHDADAVCTPLVFSLDLSSIE